MWSTHSPFLMLLYFIIFSTVSEFKSVYVGEGSVLSLVEWKNDVGLITVSTDGKSISLIIINSDLTLRTKALHTFEGKVVFASGVDFDQNGVADLLVAEEGGDLLQYSILWDFEGSPQLIGKFKFEPFLVSLGSYIAFLTISSTSQPLLYQSNFSRIFVASPGFGPPDWAALHCNSQVSMSFPSTSFFFSTTSHFQLWDLHDLLLSYALPNASRLGQSSFLPIHSSHVHILPGCPDASCSTWSIFAFLGGKWVVLYHSDLPLSKLTRVRVADLDFDGLPDLVLPPLNSGGAYLLQRDHHCAGCVPTPIGNFFKLVVLPLRDLEDISPFFLPAFSCLLLVSGGRISLSHSLSTHNQAFFFLSVHAGGTSLPASHVRLFYHTFDTPDFSIYYTLLPSFSQRALNFPFLVFGIGPNPKFVSQVDVAYGMGTSVQVVTWKSLIPNSHAYVSVFPHKKWSLKIFIIFGKSLVYTGVSLGVLFCVLVFFSLFLKWREIAEDRREKYSEAKRTILTSGSW